MGLFFKKNKEKEVFTEKALRWNRFLNEICFRDLETLSEIQKIAVLCFWYDTEMNSGGHSGYFDSCPDTVPQELIHAIFVVGYQAIADNYQKALSEGEKDGWVETDTAYYNFFPSLYDCLQEFVENNQDVLFR